MDTKPQLEIYADDVKCSHGCTTGQLDEEALFYLRSRGIGTDTARRMLIHAFAGEIIERVRKEGDPAVLEYTEKFDRVKLGLADLRVTPGEIRDAYANVDAKKVEALKLAQAKLPMAILILKNRRYAALQNFAPQFGFAPGAPVQGSELPDLDFVALAAGRNHERMLAQCLQFRPACAAMADPAAIPDFAYLEDERAAELSGQLAAAREAARSMVAANGDAIARFARRFRVGADPRRCAPGTIVLLPRGGVVLRCGIAAIVHGWMSWNR